MLKSLATACTSRSFLSLHATIVLLVTWASPAVFSDELLRWKLKAGETLRYEFSQATQTETTGSGKPMRVSMDSAMKLTWQVEAVDDRGVAAISQVIDQFRITLQTDKLDPITFDSASKSPLAGPAREIADGVQPLIGAACQLRMSDRGEILSVEPSEQLRKSVGLGEREAAAGMLTPEGMSRMLSQATVLLPEEPIASGGTWEMTQEAPAPVGLLRRQGRYIYQGRAEHAGAMLDKVTVESEFTIVPVARSTATATKLKAGRQTGIMWFDSAAGRFAASELEQQLVTERPYRDLKITVRSTGKLSMKLIAGAAP